MSHQVSQTIVTLWQTNIAIEHGHRNSGFPSYKMVIFHRFLYVYHSEVGIMFTNFAITNQRKTSQ